MKTALSESIPSDKVETTTVWSFPERGKWSTHSAKYRGNWAPQIARNLILLYSQEDDTVLDPMVGSGTTMIESKLLGRKGAAFDIHPEVVTLAQEACAAEENGKFDPKIERGDASHLSAIKDDSIDFIATHPPYMRVVQKANPPDSPALKENP